jgi:hypothetical protein
VFLLLAAFNFYTVEKYFHTVRTHKYSIVYITGPKLHTDIEYETNPHAKIYCVMLMIKTEEKIIKLSSLSFVNGNVKVFIGGVKKRYLK